MKTSKKLLLSIVVLAIAYLIFYDFSLKAELRKGDYKNLFYNFDSLNLKSFKTIRCHAANIIGIRIESSSNFGLWVDKKLKKRIKVVQTGQILNIYYVDIDKKVNNISGENIIIHCPILQKLEFSGSELKTNGNDYQNRPTSTITGFHQVIPMTILVSNNIEAEMDENNLSSLNVTVGNSPTDNATLTIAENNKVLFANIKVNKNSQLNIFSPNIIKENYSFADSSTITLKGRIFNSLISP